MNRLPQWWAVSLLLLGVGNLAAQTSVLPSPAEQNPTGMTTHDISSIITFETVDGDPINVMIHTLSNGLKIYMSVNEDEPRIQTNIAVRAGSKHDPAETTGLAHYLEHMLFKGTDKIGALDWEQEKIYLQKISDLYERHRAEKDPEKRKGIYAQIDQLSNLAAELVAANEYDKMASALGAKGTNAYTWVEQTVYVNDIPSNELERWMQLESERFRMCVLRLFHTELEAVYEEYNINQDRDFRKVSAAVNASLFPSHPYGTQTTIGEGEHLKNPSHVKIKEYFTNYYVPNNMAIVLSGDFNPDEVVKMAEKYFGNYQRKAVKPFSYEEQPPLKEVVTKEVFGQEAAWMEMSWAFPGAKTDEALMLDLIRGILYNRQAGLFDLNILQQQKMLEAQASTTKMEDYSIFRLYGKPREKQTLEDVQDLLLAELEKVKAGDFDEDMIEAVVKDFKLSEIRNNESNGARAYFMTSAFILGIDWKDYVDRYDRMAKITKSELVAFANKHFGNNYVAVFKRTGEDPSVEKVEKPEITPVSLNREESSEFTKTFLAKQAESLEPTFLEYEKLIQKKELNSGVQLDYIHNTSNPLFSLDYILEMGSNHDKKMALAIAYLPYLGTSQYSPEELQKEFFRLGLSFDVSTSNDRMYVTLSGLDESFAEGVKLFEHILADVQGNQEALDNVVKDILLKRSNAMKDKRTILRTAMANYARYGEKNPYTDKLSEEQLNEIKPAELVEKIKAITSFEHNVFYYGPRSLESVADVLNQHHQVPSEQKPLLEETEYETLDQQQNTVLFVDFPMVQAEILMVSMGSEGFDLQEYLMAELYNNYFGFGLSSIVFQEIRESKALAYSSYAYYSSPSKADDPHYLQAYVGTQVDKLPDAIPAMMEIIENMPVSEEQINNARQSIIKKIETDRITKSSIYWDYKSTQRRGFDYDLRKDMYQFMQKVTPEELIAFQQEAVKGRNYTFLVLGSKESVDLEYLKTLGPVTELTLNEVFGVEARP